MYVCRSQCSQAVPSDELSAMHTRVSSRHTYRKAYVVRRLMSFIILYLFTLLLFSIFTNSVLGLGWCFRRYGAMENGAGDKFVPVNRYARATKLGSLLTWLPILKLYSRPKVNCPSSNEYSVVANALPTVAMDRL